MKAIHIPLLICSICLFCSPALAAKLNITAFDEAYTGLKARGIRIVNNPYDPAASILAGAWHLDHIYNRTGTDPTAVPWTRHRISLWKKVMNIYFDTFQVRYDNGFD